MSKPFSNNTTQTIQTSVRACLKVSKNGDTYTRELLITVAILQRLPNKCVIITADAALIVVRQNKFGLRGCRNILPVITGIIVKLRGGRGERGQKRGSPSTPLSFPSLLVFVLFNSFLPPSLSLSLSSLSSSLPLFLSLSLSFSFFLSLFLFFLSFLLSCSSLSCACTNFTTTTVVSTTIIHM